jgi:serine-type D-Ala-D-Ala carboxypeptidase
MVRIDAARLERARALLERAAVDGAFGGAVALIALAGDVVAHWAVGDAQTVPDRRPMQLDSIFDLASLTKPIAGATATLVLLEDGVWSLDDTVAKFIPEFAANQKQVVTLRHLLTHSSGINGWSATYTRARDPEAALAFICGLPLGYAPGTDVQYSDIGYSVLGHLIRRVTGEGLDALLARRVFRPLGMADTLYRPPAALRPRIVATERGNRYEQAMVRSLGESFDDWRNPDVVQVGEVNDGNTYYALGGVSSHAGLFSTAADVFRFASMYLGWRAGVLARATLAEAVANQTAGLPKARGLGWELLRKGRQAREEWAPSPAAARVHPAARYDAPSPRPYGDLLSGRTFGHTGFTGTSMAVDPESGLVIILLTNRTHPDASNDRITSVRPRFHNLIAASLVDS